MAVGLGDLEYRSRQCSDAKQFAVRLSRKIPRRRGKRNAGKMMLVGAGPWDTAIKALAIGERGVVS